ncbi:MAG: type II toxin-antitoxin system mRNA interferase toxin, RelE/StbE family [Leptospiraceae bacterium]|nr:type II toxin-antitoxin system mRNA interferase toxin, RelE/StbE family [Leptospiraceae bacterium]MCK6382191.1 type II toxin-antitoxin system mRNA interferase toxin, RelE/StbE family [Leptospiraceae bacterium]
MLNNFEIAETESFISKIKETKYKKIYKKIREYIYPQLKLNPFFGNNIKKLKGEFEGVYRYRIGDYRLFYQIKNKQVLIIILDISERKDSYR